ncbi:galactokinase [Kwoniella newhampshirensis]|uniref:Galactokinase n=1 Tax=Kwoniella newhampshirensis TaxID=1651941 RepID=A0AAW0Z5Y7_9TREE
MAAQAPIPKFNSLAEIYPSSSAVLREGKRWNDVVGKFQEVYGTRPTHIVRAPGRVNVLGEHVDYSLFPVLPAAIEEDIVFAFRPTASTADNPAHIRLANIDKKHHYPPCDFPITHSGEEWDVKLTEAKGWDKYVRVALLECLEELFPGGEELSGSDKHASGMDVLVSGTVPPGSGLSSSAAMVVGAVIVFLVANDLEKSKTKADVVHLAIASEHRMGLRTGGMDQSASALCLPYSLLHLSFHPTLHPAPLPLPPTLAIIITNSLAPHSLTDSAPEEYNLRVVEMLCATRILLEAWGLDSKVGKQRKWLREVLELWDGEEEDEGKLLEKALGEIDGILGGERKERGWTREEMSEKSGMSKEDFEEMYLHFLETRASHLHLYQRTYHTLTESLRVHNFVQLCREIDSNPSTTPASDPRILQLGKYLNQSHDCMRDVYECTHPWVDELQKVCVEAGAVGSRMTGGGWGGSVVSLLPVDEIPTFLKNVREKYTHYNGLTDEQFGEAAFATLPGHGAGGESSCFRTSG